MYRRILLAFDGSEAGRRALLECADIDNLLQAELHLLAVVPPPAGLYTPGGAAVEGGHEADEQEYREILNEGLRLLSERSVRATSHLAHGEPAEQIRRFAGELDCELVVVGHQRRASWLGRWLGGSVASSLIEDAPCSVLIAICA